MAQTIIKTIVRTRFALTSRDRATNQAAASLARYLELAAQVDADAGARPVRVPRMPGVDADMRRWSFFMLLEHNAIVNRAIGGVVQSLARGEQPPGGFDPKRDVMPSAAPGDEQVDNFRQSVEEYLAVVPTLGDFRGSLAKQHPVFGTFDAHRWHCMFGFHLTVHERQARYVVAHASP